MRTMLAVTLGVGALLTLAGCASSGTSGSPSPSARSCQGEIDVVIATTGEASSAAAKFSDSLRASVGGPASAMGEVASNALDLSNAQKHAARAYEALAAKSVKSYAVKAENAEDALDIASDSMQAFADAALAYSSWPSQVNADALNAAVVNAQQDPADAAKEVDRATSASAALAGDVCF